jgi:hypothetical protein
VLQIVQNVVLALEAVKQTASLGRPEKSDNDTGEA